MNALLTFGSFNFDIVEQNESWQNARCPLERCLQVQKLMNRERSSTEKSSMKWSPVHDRRSRPSVGRYFASDVTDQKRQLVSIALVVHSFALSTLPNTAVWSLLVCNITKSYCKHSVRANSQPALLRNQVYRSESKGSPLGRFQPRVTSERVFEQMSVATNV